jgi:hypothetical protein
MIQENLEKSIIKVNRLIKKGLIKFPEIKELIRNIIIYDMANDEYLSELEMAIDELNYKLSLYKEVLPDSYFIKTDTELIMMNLPCLT